MDRKTALITGASGGIGYELAKVFAQENFDCVLVARNQDRLEKVAKELEETYGVTAYVLPKDLSRRESPDEIFVSLQTMDVSIDALVNNAGFGTYGFFWKTDLQEELNEIQVNMVSLTHLTRLFLPGMLERGSGWVMNVASTAAFQPGPLMAIYYASKSYVLLLSEAVANELEGSGVSMTVLCPGPTRSEFHQRAGVPDSPFMTGRVMDAATVARIGFDGMMRGKAIVIPGFMNQLLAWLVRFGPRSWVTRSVRRIQGRAD